jgi:hypothetical protein
VGSIPIARSNLRCFRSFGWQGKLNPASFAVVASPKAGGFAPRYSVARIPGAFCR